MHILFKAVVEPANEPPFKPAKHNIRPAGEVAAKLKGPVRRVRVNLTIDPHGLSFDKQDGGRRGTAVEFAILA
jgi:hypothetical protein